MLIEDLNLLLKKCKMDNLIYTNPFGCVYNDKIYINEREIELNLSYIKEFRLISYKTTRIRFYLFSLAIFFLLLFVYVNIMIFVFIALCFILSCLLFSNKKYCLEIYTTNINDDFIFEIKKKDVNHAKTFVYEVIQYFDQIEFILEINKNN